MGNVSIGINWINSVSLEKHCDQAHGRATYYLKFETQYEQGDFFPSEKVQLALTPNAVSVAKFERIAAAINSIMSDPDDAADAATAPMVGAIADKSLCHSDSEAAIDALVLAVPEGGFGNERALVTLENLRNAGWNVTKTGDGGTVIAPTQAAE
jgi:hypothetical protein